MSTFKVRVLYDFQGEPNTAEQSVSAGEILTVTRTDVGEGWWEGINSRGQSGLFPEAYVEKIESGPPSIPPPAPPAQPSWGLPGMNNKNSLPDAPVNQEEDWDDDWDDDKSDDRYEVPHNINNQQNYYGNTGETNQNYNYQLSRQSTQSDAVSLSGSIRGDNKGTITKKSLNIFSSAVRSGLEGYILGQSKDVAATASKRIHIYRDSDDTIGRWEQISNPYTVQITSPKKESKMAGFKSFIAYQLTPSFTNIEVSRRYKHFDWLHDRLTEKFNLIAVPPLPDKQVSNRYDESFIEHRRALLQEFTNYMCRHPVLSTCDVWIHFLTCTDEKQWKQGKRSAEKDQLIGASFCLAIEAPEKEIMPSVVEAKIDDNMKYVERMDHCVKNLMNLSQDQQKKCVGLYGREFRKIGDAFMQLGSAFEGSNHGMFTKASVDVKNIGAAYATIAKLYEDQGKIDWQPLFDKLYIYKGITSSLPDILHMQRMSEQKKKECERTNQVQQLALTDVRRRSDVITYTVFSELNHFQQERDNEMKRGLKDFLQEQLNFYRNVVAKLEDTLNNFE